MTDGAPRQIKIGKRTIKFKATVHDVVAILVKACIYGNNRNLIFRSLSEGYKYSIEESDGLYILVVEQ
ncbi:hypothetical protein A3860_34585 [Niastella vici]|uniref:Uncharacterized protein n=1 Tax=Niastella vici TaxID=1703345 RepID=A0A1V9FPM7_9BACT|nr:hypothetical protein A3860_34585 [Niastella vici]